MVKLQVNKFVYQVSTFAFYSLIMLGLIWQVMQISVNFFVFDVSKDINVIMPEEKNETDKILNICFTNSEMFDYSKYLRFLLKKSHKTDSVYKNWIWKLDKREFREDLFHQELTVEERFNISTSIIGLEPSRLISEYIFSNKYCYQVLWEFAQVYFFQEEVGNITTVLLSVGQRLPKFDNRRMITNYIDFESGYSTVIGIKSHTYTIHKLEWPYIDECINYGLLNYSSRYDAVTRCDSEKLFKFKNGSTVGRCRYFTRNSDMKYLKSKMGNYFCNYKPECEQTFKYFDCYQTIYLSNIERTDEFFQETQLTINMAKDTDPSFKIESKPRIDKIDFITYIFGALGSWLGFTFLMLNPVPYVMKIRSLGSETDSEVDISMINQLIKKIDRSDSFCTKLKSRINKLEQENIRKDRVIDGLIEEINTINHWKDIINQRYARI